MIDGKKILVVEDEDILRTNVTRMLELEKFDVKNACNGRVALERLSEGVPDLILCDVMMPEMNGYEFLRQVRANKETSGTPFIFLTAKTEKQDFREGMSLGADDYLPKPFSRDELLKAITSRLKKHDLLFREAEGQLEELRNNLANALPHEYLTPLNGILGFSKILIHDSEILSTEEVKEIAIAINDSAQRLSRVTTNILTFSRLQLVATNKELQAQMRNAIAIDLEGTIASVIYSRAEGAGRMNDLSLSVRESAIGISATYLMKIIEELIDNALKFSSKGSIIRVKGSIDFSGKIYRLRISDMGIGMSQDQVAKIGAYMQFDRTRNEQQGFGLGLSITQQIINLHNGSLNVQSVLDNGTTVEVLLPITAVD